MRKRIYVFSQLHVNAHIFASIHVYIRACICILIGMHSHTPTLIRDPYSNYLWKNKGKIVRIYEPHVSISISPIINASTYINYIFILDAYFFFNVKANSHALFDLWSTPHQFELSIIYEYYSWIISLLAKICEFKTYILQLFFTNILLDAENGGVIYIIRLVLLILLVMFISPSLL